MNEIAHTRIRYGFGRIFVLLRREGFTDNHKRVYRIYKACGLNLRTKRPRRSRSAAHRLERLQTKGINQVWSMDFLQDALFNGERFRILAIVDNCSKICHALLVGKSLKGAADVVYLTADGMKLLLAQPDTTKKKGRRDQMLLSLMFECAGRVQEIIDLVPARLNFGKPTLLTLKGKGNKTRIVPLTEKLSIMLKKYMQEYGLLRDQATDYPLFANGRGDKLSRMGITAIMRKYSIKARTVDASLIPTGISPHSLRHSKAMLLQKSEVNIVAIRDFLGHASVTTTEIYARIDNTQKRDALEKTSLLPVSTELPEWQTNRGLLEWLESLGR